MPAFSQDIENHLLNLAKRIKSISDIGLLYSPSEYDRERYTELKEISMEMQHLLTGKEIRALRDFYLPVKDYPTAKVDIRGLLLSEEGKILMVKESKDSKWSLPGGWADIGYSPKETIIKEFKEETGLDIQPRRLLAVFDKKFHPHPSQPHYVYKMAFLCESLSGEIKKGFDVLDVQYFDLHHLPELSEDRILKTQIELLFRITSAHEETYFD